MLQINIMGVSHRKHELEYHIIRETGQPAINFVHFISPAAVVLGGKEYIVSKDTCIIYTPGHRQEYRNYNGILLNNYITFQVNDPDFTGRFGLPENEIFNISDGDEVTDIMEWLAWAVADKTEPHGEDIVNRIVGLFKTLADLYVDNNTSLRRLLEMKQRFIALRDEMRDHPKGWTIEKMAKQVWLTRSRFTVLYNHFFGISPNADLINIKVEYAKKLLVSTDLSIMDVSEQCGYSSVEYFIRLFSRQVDKTPLQYRKAFNVIID